MSASFLGVFKQSFRACVPDIECHSQVRGLIPRLVSVPPLFTYKAIYEAAALKQDILIILEALEREKVVNESLWVVVRDLQDKNEALDIFSRALRLGFDCQLAENHAIKDAVAGLLEPALANLAEEHAKIEHLSHACAALKGKLLELAAAHTKAESTTEGAHEQVAQTADITIASLQKIVANMDASIISEIRSKELLQHNLGLARKEVATSRAVLEAVQKERDTIRVELERAQKEVEELKEALAAVVVGSDMGMRADVQCASAELDMLNNPSAEDRLQARELRTRVNKNSHPSQLRMAEKRSIDGVECMQCNGPQPGYFGNFLDIPGRSRPGLQDVLVHAWRRVSEGRNWTFEAMRCLQAEQEKSRALETELAESNRLLMAATKKIALIDNSMSTVIFDADIDTQELVGDDNDEHQAARAREATSVGLTVGERETCRELALRARKSPSPRSLLGAAGNLQVDLAGVADVTAAAQKPGETNAALCTPLVKGIISHTTTGKKHSPRQEVVDSPIIDMDIRSRSLSVENPRSLWAELVRENMALRAGKRSVEDALAVKVQENRILIRKNLHLRKEAASSKSILLMPGAYISTPLPRSLDDKENSFPLSQASTPTRLYSTPLGRSSRSNAQFADHSSPFLSPPSTRELFTQFAMQRNARDVAEADSRFFHDLAVPESYCSPIS